MEEAKEIVHTVHFRPLGLRPVYGVYCKPDFKEYIRFMNEKRLVIVQIEEPEPLRKFDEICKLDGIDMIIPGPGDFSYSIGHPAEFDHPEVNRVRKLIVETAHKYGKFAGTVSVPSLKQCYLEGFDFVNCGADVAAIGANCDAVMEKYKNCAG